MFAKNTLLTQKILNFIKIHVVELKGPKFKMAAMVLEIDGYTFEIEVFVLKF